MSGIGKYLLSVSSAVLMMGVLITIVPSGSIRRTVSFVSTLLIILAVVMPIAKINVRNIAKAITMNEIEVEQMRTGVEVTNREILSQLIKKRCEAYILDKAEKLEIDIQAEIILSEEGEYPYPVEIVITGKVSSEDRSYMQKVIEQDLGIALEYQEWR